GHGPRVGLAFRSRPRPDRIPRPVELWDRKPRADLRRVDPFEGRVLPVDTNVGRSHSEEERVDDVDLLTRPGVHRCPFYLERQLVPSDPRLLRDLPIRLVDRGRVLEEPRDRRPSPLEASHTPGAA